MNLWLTVVTKTNYGSVAFLLGDDYFHAAKLDDCDEYSKMRSLMKVRLEFPMDGSNNASPEINLNIDESKA